MDADFSVSTTDRGIAVETVVESESVNTKYADPIARNAKVAVFVSMASLGSSAENATVVLFVSTVDKKVTAEIAEAR